MSSRSKKYTATAGSHPESGYIALYGMPGQQVRTVKEGGKTKNFDSSMEAEIEAHFALVRELNADRKRAVGHQIVPNSDLARMTGPELIELMDKAQVDADMLASTYGTTLERVLDWQRGIQEIPHQVRVLMLIYAVLPASKDVARQATRDAKAKRKSDPAVLPQHLRG